MPMHVRLGATAPRLYPIQGSYRSWKTWKVMEFKNLFPDLECHGI